MKKEENKYLKIKELIAQNKIKEAIVELKLVSKTEIYNAVIMCSSRLEDIENKYNIGVVTLGELNLEVSKIRNTLLNCVDSLYKEKHERLINSSSVKVKPIVKSSMKRDLTVKKQIRDFVTFNLRVLHTGMEYKITVPYDKQTKIIRQEVVEELGIEFRLSNGNKLDLKFSSKETGTVLDDRLTFRENNINDGYTLFLIADFIAAG